MAESCIHTSLLDLAQKMRVDLLGGPDNRIASEEIGAGPDAPEWLNECFARYVQLYRDGVFECVRAEKVDGNNQRARVYFSGGLDLTLPPVRSANITKHNRSAIHLENERSQRL